MLSPIDDLGAEEWIPKTQGSTDWSESWYLEGGWLKLNKNSEFAHTALENFPKYDLDVSNCWACVGKQAAITNF